MQTLEQARTDAVFGNRQQEILDAVDHLLKVHGAWENDPKAPDVPSEALERAILGAIEVCTHGDIPAQCRDLCVVAMPRLAFEWEEYADPESSHRRTDGTPTARFWAAFQAVIQARKGAVPFVPKRPEPVDELLRQGVSYEQIGRHIYGYNGEGPFLRRDGVVDIRLIQQEAAESGSVVPQDWLHPLEQQRKQDFERSVDHRIAAAKAREESQRETSVDRSSIEDFLLQGADPNVIAKVKGVPIGDVYAVKLRLETEGKWPPKPEANRDDFEEFSEPRPAATEEDEEEPFDALAYIAENAQTQGVAEIVAGLKANGVKMTVKQVKAAISELAKEAPAAQ